MKLVYRVCIYIHAPIWRSIRNAFSLYINWYAPENVHFCCQAMCVHVSSLLVSIRSDASLSKDVGIIWNLLSRICCLSNKTHASWSRSEQRQCYQDVVLTMCSPLWVIVVDRIVCTKSEEPHRSRLNVGRASSDFLRLRPGEIIITHQYYRAGRTNPQQPHTSKYNHITMCTGHDGGTGPVLPEPARCVSRISANRTQMHATYNI